MKDFVALYLLRTQQIAATAFAHKQVTLQFFQRANNVVLCGIDEVLALLRAHTPWQTYTTRYLPEGTLVQANEVVLELCGSYAAFGFLEGVIDGVLARQSSIATNARAALTAVAGKRVVFMGDRADHYRNQAGDGYAAAQGGVTTQVTAAHAAQHGGFVVGTMPHALIALAQGDLVAALQAYAQTFPAAPLTALVDFANDVIGDSLRALAAFGPRLVAVRVDTSANMSDVMFARQVRPPRGVVPTQIKRLRRALDVHGGTHVKIIVSSGFDAAKIARFEKAHTPVDVYGVGAALLKVWVNFTADVVQVDGRNLAKAGRGYRPMRDFHTLT